jgi:hypothetical protein
MSEEVKALIKGLIMGTGIIGFGGILVNSSWVPGTVLLLTAVVGFIVTKKVWNH